MGLPILKAVDLSAENPHYRDLLKYAHKCSITTATRKLLLLLNIEL